MTFQTIFWLTVAVLTFIVAPIVVVWGLAYDRRHKRSDRRGGGGSVSSMVGGAMLELDRYVRPSVEHTIEAEHQTLKREDDTGGE